jgi:succinyl-diaminopimelate desuccinylase
MFSVLEIVQQLIQCASVTPQDAGCQKVLQDYLKRLGFVIEPMPFNHVKNFWAKRGIQEPVFVFSGHTDVVPPGPLEAWDTPPFQPTIKDHFLFGRGSCDMKASLAAMLVACSRFIKQFPNHQGSIAWLITGDEEGIAVDGTVKVIDVLKKRKEPITCCLVGEPTCEQYLGDTIKIGRRGSLSAKITVHGQQGHVAYPHKAINAIHQVIPAFNELIARKWDQGNEQFQPSSFQFSNIDAGTGANNVIPGVLNAQFNLRYSPEITAETIQEIVHTIFQKHKLKYEINWRHSAQPFLSKSGRLLEKTQQAITEVTGIKPTLSTSGGTSDARFIAPLSIEVLEFGPINRTIHQNNECIGIDELEQLTCIYQRILEEILLC